MCPQISGRGERAGRRAANRCRIDGVQVRERTALRPHRLAWTTRNKRGRVGMDADELLIGTLARMVGDTQHPEATLAEFSRCVRMHPLQVIPAEGRCRRVLYLTKLDWLLELVGDEDRVPSDVAILHRFGLVAPTTLELISRFLGGSTPSLVFIGDLNPQDLATFACLVSGGTAAKPKSDDKVVYAGVRDTWIDICLQEFRNPFIGDDRSSDESKEAQFRRAACVALSDAERDALALLRRLPVSWETLLGQNSLALLDSGWRLDVEGATNGRLYSTSLRERLRDLVFE